MHLLSISSCHSLRSWSPYPCLQEDKSRYKAGMLSSTLNITNILLFLNNPGLFRVKMRMTNAGVRVDEYSGFQTEWSEQAITVFKYFLKTSKKSMFLVQKKLKKKHRRNGTKKFVTCSDKLFLMISNLFVYLI